MAALRILVAALALVAVPPVLAGSLAAKSVASSGVERWRPFIEEASTRFGVPVAWIERVMQAESGGRTTLGGRPIVSRAGAMGLMQLMPGTWGQMRSALGLGPDPHNPRDNILAGTLYLRLMYDRFGYPGLFGAYNAGPGRYAAWVAGRGQLPAETRAYLASVTDPGIVRPDAAAASTPAPQLRPALFFPLGHAPASAPRRGMAGPLFVALRTAGESERGAPAAISAGD